MPSRSVWLALLLLTTPAHAAWFDAAWPCRRSVDLAWNADRPLGRETAQVELYTDGRALPTGADLRVATDDGKPVPFRLLAVGPGDRVRLAFAMAPDVKRYQVYFGHPNPPPPPPPLDDPAGLLLESRLFPGGNVRTFEQVRRAWDRGGEAIGTTLVGNAFVGFNPFGDQAQTVSRYTGTLLPPIEGDYVLTVAADDVAALYLDDKPAVLAHLAPADSRFQTTLHLTPRRHPFTLYHVNLAGPQYVSVCWQPPTNRRPVVIGKSAFGPLYAGGNVTVGKLEVKGKALVADFAADRVAECFVGTGAGGDEQYVFDYRFTAAAKAGVPVTTNWDFGDGQTAAGPAVDHVYLRAGVYAVRSAAHAGANTDAQTCRLVVGRDYLHLPTAHAEPPVVLSPIAAKLDLPAVPVGDLPRLVRLYLSADQLDLALPPAAALAAATSHPDDAAAVAALTGVEQACLADNRPEPAVALWDRVPAHAAIRPQAAARAADVALWWVGDVAKAVALLAPAHDGHDAQLAYAQATLLAGHADAARAVLARLPVRAGDDRRAALSGADARTVEFYITEGDPDGGDAAWAKWMAEFPTDYLTGYSVLLRTRLMRLRHRDAAAAAVAAAFADAVPASSYAPQLLDAASKLLANTDPARSATLHQQLKDKYPEDPLSQK